MRKICVIWQCAALQALHKRESCLVRDVKVEVGRVLPVGHAYYKRLLRLGALYADLAPGHTQAHVHTAPLQQAA